MKLLHGGGSFYFGLWRKERGLTDNKVECKTGAQRLTAVEELGVWFDG